MCEEWAGSVSTSLYSESAAAAAAAAADARLAYCFRNRAVRFLSKPSGSIESSALIPLEIERSGS